MTSLKQLLASSLFCVCFMVNATTNLSTEEDKFLTLAQEYESRYFARFPEEGVLRGRSNVDLDRFSDPSYAAISVWEKEEDRFLSQLNNINQASMTDPVIKLSYQLLTERLTDKQSRRICRKTLWDVRPLNGWHTMTTMLASVQPVGTPKLRQLALTRWKTFPTLVEHEISNLKLGLETGYTSPKPAVNRVLNQIKQIIDSPIESSPYYSMADRDLDSVFKADIRQLISTVINPSLKNYADYLERQYLPHARTNVGVWDLPNGDLCYKALIKYNTTLSISPQDIHTVGLTQMQRISEEVAEIGLRRYGTSDMKTIFALANQESSGVFADEQAMLDYDAKALERIKQTIPQWFKQVPKTAGVIKPYPPYLAKSGAPGQYTPPKDDGSPGIFYINTYHPQQKSRMDLESTLFHELIPGHHFEVASQFENKRLPNLNKYLWNSGFGEGWGLYAERLADQMGVFQDEISKLGMLSNEALRAARLVVDSGMHHFHWSRAQAVDYLKSHSGLEENIIEGEVDRYLTMPGQATAYMLGKLEIESLRDHAKTTLGDNFDIRDFHYQVLKNGNISLPLLKQQIEHWLNQSK